MEKAFLDYFSQQAKLYAAYRPRYPEEMFAWLHNTCTTREHAWDCGTGNGQAALSLAKHFDRVIATDASESQIAAAPSSENISFRVATSEQSGLEDNSVDLITVAQALHWFDLDVFYAEVRRVLKPGGVIAAWTYGVNIVDHPVVNPMIQHLYYETVGPCWPPERKHVESGYSMLAFPFERLQAPAFAMREKWPLHVLCGYLRTWSATQRYLNLYQVDPVSELEQTFKTVGLSREDIVEVQWPLALLVGRKPL